MAIQHSREMQTSTEPICQSLSTGLQGRAYLTKNRVAGRTPSIQCASGIFTRVPGWFITVSISGAHVRNGNQGSAGQAQSER